MHCGRDLLHDLVSRQMFFPDAGFGYVVAPLIKVLQVAASVITMVRVHAVPEGFNPFPYLS